MRQMGLSHKDSTF